MLLTYVIGDVSKAVSSGFMKIDKQDLIDKNKSCFAKNQLLFHLNN